MNKPLFFGLFCTSLCRSSLLILTVPKMKQGGSKSSQTSVLVACTQSPVPMTGKDWSRVVGNAHGKNMFAKGNSLEHSSAI